MIYNILGDFDFSFVFLFDIIYLCGIIIFVSDISNYAHSTVRCLEDSPSHWVAILPGVKACIPRQVTLAFLCVLGLWIVLC